MLLPLIERYLFLKIGFMVKKGKWNIYVKLAIGNMSYAIKIPNNVYKSNNDRNNCGYM